MLFMNTELSEFCHFSSCKVSRIVADVYLNSKAVNDSCSVKLSGKPREDVV